MRHSDTPPIVTFKYDDFAIGTPALGICKVSAKGRFKVLDHELSFKGL
jgi:hypothetical protein